ncbi:MAG TPA: Rieske (2Fe-2S) protein [Candidatus Dormibacteraeota bacterium]|jgi:3-phenylpropionate/trans-cinnamate dioxygenase ferredoxin subunit|nr:Rieske (2Fe-2S) protein [Candidatus Dormibacteraeota bacterium]
MKYVLFPADSLAKGSMRAVSVGGVAVVVVRASDGGYYALRDVCSHQGARLSEGRLEAPVVADGNGGYEVATDNEVLRCPWHWYEFSLSTGRSLGDPAKTRVRSYKVEVEDGQVTIER